MIKIQSNFTACIQNIFLQNIQLFLRIKIYINFTQNKYSLSRVLDLFYGFYIDKIIYLFSSRNVVFYYHTFAKYIIDPVVWTKSSWGLVVESHSIKHEQVSSRTPERPDPRDFLFTPFVKSTNFYLRRAIYRQQQQRAEFRRQRWKRRCERVLRCTATCNPGDIIAGEQPESGPIMLRHPEAADILHA